MLQADTLGVSPRLRTGVDLAPQTTYHTATGHGVHTFTRRAIMGDTLHPPFVLLRSTQQKVYRLYANRTPQAKGLFVMLSRPSELTVMVSPERTPSGA